MTHGSLFAGIGGFDLGFGQAGFTTLWAVEKEPFCRAILATHFPETRLFNDVHDTGKHNLAPVDVITGGFPCQDLSIAGKRAGLSASRSGLFFEAARVIGELKPAWFVLENVPGLFSSNQGEDFRIVVQTLCDIGYGLAWRVLDSQYFGVAQRRRRVFIVGRFGEPCPAEVLFESESGAGDFTESGAERPRAAGEIAGCLGSIGDGGFSTNCEKAADGYLQLVANAISASNGHHGHSSPRGDGSDNLVTTYKRRGGYGWSENHGTSATLECQGGRHQGGSDSTPIIAYHENLSGNVAAADNARALRSGASHSYQFVSSSNPEHEERSSQQLHATGKVDGAMHGNGDVSAPPDSHGVRNFTELPKGMDSARYRALGNAVTVSTVKWIANRIAAQLSKNGQT